MNQFGEMPDGCPVERVTLRGGGLTAQVLSYGSVLQDLRLDGHAPPLVLGFPDFAPYLTDSPYFGATAGRCANRIRDGHFLLSGEHHRHICTGSIAAPHRHLLLLLQDHVVCERSRQLERLFGCCNRQCC